MSRYVPRLVAPGSAPRGALVFPLVEDLPASPLGEHELVPEIAWMVERDGAWVHVMEADEYELEEMQGSAIEVMLDEPLDNEALEQLPGFNAASNGPYAAELLLDHDHLAALHDMLKMQGYFAAAPRRGRFLIGGVGGGVEGTRMFVEYVRQQHDAAPAADRISPVTLFIRDGAPTAVIGELQLIALAQAAGERD